MGSVKSCCIKQMDDKLMVTKMDLSHCGCLEVPHIVFNAERCIETLILASNQISSLPPQLFHCQEMKHLNLNDNILNNIPPAIGSFQNLISLKLDKNNLQELPDNLKMCKKLKRLSLSNNPWKQMPNIVAQLITLEEVYMNECELNYLPASIGRLNKLKIMELRNNNLCNLPLSMTRLECLTRLDISDNEFNEFPVCIPKLHNLKELLLDNNDIEEIIDVKNLVHLEHFDSSYNHISNVSETIGCCTNLNMLNLSFNYIEQLPNSIGNITHLQTLHLEMNELTEIPKSIGKLSNLEELNLCNNKLYSLPNTIGLLRNLRNLNVSRNMVEEFPPEIGSCSKLAIINAAYNRLQVLPSEIGYLNNLKVLDLVGNFLMYLPITIINLQGVRAIWLSANQNVPLIPFTEDLNLASGERFLTNIALPQLGEIPLKNLECADKKVFHNEKTSSWNKKIRFAEDEDILPGKLHRTPTPFPKELRAPNRKHQRSEEQKLNDNYVNVIDGKVSDQENLQPVTSPAAESGSSLLNCSESSVTKIKEANIRRNAKDVSETPSHSISHFHDFYVENGCTFDEETKRCQTHKELEPESLERLEINLPDSTKSPLKLTNNLENNDFTSYKNPPSPSYQNLNQTLSSNRKENSDCAAENCTTQCTRQNVLNVEGNSQNRFRQQVIYSNLHSVHPNNINDNKKESFEINSQRTREMYQSEIIYANNGNCKFIKKASEFPTSRDYYIANLENQPNNFSSDSSTYRENFTSPSINFNKDFKRMYCTTPSNNKKNGAYDEASSLRIPWNENISTEPERPSSKQDFISLAEQMKNKNISPPSYEIAKMYSTKAALFENNRVDQLKSN